MRVSRLDRGLPALDGFQSHIGVEMGGAAIPHSKRASKRSLGFEYLEDRTPLAGDVTATVVAGVLQITGDADANSILVRQQGAVWNVSSADSSTTINGSLSSQRFSGVSDLAVDLLAGDDFIKVFNGALSGSLAIASRAGGNSTVQLLKLKATNITVNTGDGADRITISSCQASAGLQVATFVTDSDGADEVSITSSSAGSFLDVAAGNGSDKMEISNFKAGTTMSVATLASHGAGNDIVKLVNCSANGDLHIATGDGNDSVIMSGVKTKTSFRVDTFTTSVDDNDAVSIASASAGTFFEVNTGDGSDAVTLSKLAATTDLTVSTTGSARDGSDTVKISNSIAGRALAVDTGNGADDVAIDKVKAKDVTVSTASTSSDGNDNVAMSQITVSNTVLISTGGGTDTVIMSAILGSSLLECDLGSGIYDRLEVAKSKSMIALLGGGGTTGDTLVTNRNQFAAQTNDGFEFIIAQSPRRR
jgi:hypothetical protein